MNQKTIEKRRNNSTTGHFEPNVNVKREFTTGDSRERVVRLEQKLLRALEGLRYYASSIEHDGGKRARVVLKDTEAA